MRQDERLRSFEPPAEEVCHACQGAHRRHTCGQHGASIQSTPKPEKRTTSKGSKTPQQRDKSRLHGEAPAPLAETKREAAKRPAPTAKSAPAPSIGTRSQPTQNDPEGRRTSHRRSAPPLRLADGTTTAVAGSAGRSASPAPVAVTELRTTTGAPVTATPAAVEPEPEPELGGAEIICDPATDDLSSEPVLWIGDSTFARVAASAAWSGLNIRSEPLAVNGERPLELLRRLDKIADKHPHPRALVLCTGKNVLATQLAELIGQNVQQVVQKTRQRFPGRPVFVTGICCAHCPNHDPQIHRAGSRRAARPPSLAPLTERDDSTC